jgi:hypothetical protein
MADTKWVDVPTDQPDDYMPIVVEDEMTIKELIDLKARTYGRFDFTVDPSGLFANITYVNYYLGYNNTKVKEYIEKGCFVTGERINKQVVLK